MSFDRSSLAPSSLTIFSLLMPASGHRGALMEARLAPFAAVEDGGQRTDRVVDIGVPRVERREAEAQQVGGAEVADHAARDQRLHDRVATAPVREADLAAALLRIARRHQLQIVPGAARFDLLDEELGELDRLAAQRPDAAERLGAAEGVEPAVERRQ